MKLFEENKIAKGVALGISIGAAIGSTMHKENSSNEEK